MYGSGGIFPEDWISSWAVVWDVFSCGLCNGLRTAYKRPFSAIPYCDPDKAPGERYGSGQTGSTL